MKIVDKEGVEFDVVVHKSDGFADGLMVDFTKTTVLSKPDICVGPQTVRVLLDHEAYQTLIQYLIENQ